MDDQRTSGSGLDVCSQGALLLPGGEVTPPSTSPGEERSQFVTLLAPEAEPPAPVMGPLLFDPAARHPALNSLGGDPSGYSFDFVDYVGLLAAPHGRRFDPRLKLLEEWSALQDEIQRARSAASSKRARRSFDASREASRRVGVTRTRLAQVDAKLDAAYGPVPPVQALLQVLDAQLEGLAEGSPVRLAVTLSVRAHHLLLSLPSSVLRSRSVRCGFASSTSLAEDEVRVRRLFEEHPAPASPPPSSMSFVDESWELPFGDDSPARSRMLPVPDRVLSKEGYEVFATLRADGMGSVEAAEAAERISPSV